MPPFLQPSQMKYFSPSCPSNHCTEEGRNLPCSSLPLPDYPPSFLPKTPGFKNPVNRVHCLLPRLLPSSTDMWVVTPHSQRFLSQYLLQLLLLILDYLKTRVDDPSNTLCLQVFKLFSTNGLYHPISATHF